MLPLDIFSLDVLTLVMLLPDIYMLLPDTSLYHLTSYVLPPDMLLLETCPCYDITYHLPLVMLTLDL